MASYASEQVYGVASKDVAQKGRAEEYCETASMLRQVRPSSEEHGVDVRITPFGARAYR